MEKEMATHSRILALRIPGTEEPGRLQSMGSERVGLDLAHTHGGYLLFYNRCALLVNLAKDQSCAFSVNAWIRSFGILYITDGCNEVCLLALPFL